MRILFGGVAPAADHVTAQALHAAGHELATDPTPVDAAIVSWRQGSNGIRKAVESLKPTGHLLLISTHAVYPSTPATAPWTETTFHPADDFAGGATTEARFAREAERTVVVGEGRRTNWTILRPSIVEGPDDPTDRTWWTLSRIMDQGPLILPDDGPRLFRHVLADDLARAVTLLLGEPRAFGRILNVTGEGLLTPLGYALMLMDGLGRRVPVQWVPGASWRDAGLPQPMNESETTSLIEVSPLLAELGWKPQPEVEWVESLARTLSQRPAPKPDEAHRALERRVYQEALTSHAFDVSFNDENLPPLPKQWKITVSPGAPASLAFEAHFGNLPAPVLKVLGVAFDDTVERLLSGDLPARPEPLVPGQAALLEVLEPGKTPFQPGDRVVPIARMPCETADCPWCQDRVERFMGVDADGFTASHVTAPGSHLVPVPDGLGRAALLAHPLARLIEAFEPLLENSEGPVWILGTTALARLAGLLARDAERHVVHLTCTAEDDSQLVDGLRLESITSAAEKVRDGISLRAGLCANLSAARHGESLLFESSEATAKLLTPFGSAIEPSRVVKLSPGALTRQALEKALTRLERWASFRDLDAMLSATVDPRNALDAFLAPPFELGIVGGPE